jgi:hypothetical protein
MIKALINKLLHSGRQADYVSEVDQFLQKFDHEHTPSESQKREIEKHKDIHTRKRDERIKW